MEKIFFVEDQLSMNIPTIIKLFKKYLDRDEIKNLEKMENSGFGATNTQVKEALKDNPVLDIEYSFAGALHSLQNRDNSSTLFIIDRNLSNDEVTDLEDIQKVMPDFDENMLDRYLEREGDFLLLLLALKHIDCARSFYFMSAYPGSEGIRCAPLVGELIRFDIFSKYNFIEKGDSKARDEFVNEIVNNLRKASFIGKHRDVFEILRSDWLDNNIRKDLLEVAIQMDNYQNVNDNLVKCRRILEHILNSLARKEADFFPTHIVDSKGERREVFDSREGRLNIGSALQSLRDGNKVPIMFNNLASPVNWVTSKYGVHADASKDHEPSEYAVHSCVYALLEILRCLKPFGR
jgi:hypothetical protein